MDGNNQLFTLAQALADPLRLVMLQQLMEGPATVSELQSLTGESQSKVSNHLALLRERDLVRATREGRQMIYTLRDASVGQLVESLTVVAGMIPAKLWKSPQLIAARTCYDHLAGRYGVALFDALLAQEAIKEPAEMHGEVELGASRLRAQTGPSAAPIWEEFLGQPCGHTVSSEAGWSNNKGRVRSLSPSWASRTCGNNLAFRWKRNPYEYRL